MTSEDFSEVYWYSGLQALFVTVFQTSVDFLCKTSYKSSSLLEYFDCFQSNHIVGCCKINFSDLSQIRREKFCFAIHASNVSTFCCTFLHDCSCFVTTFGQLFTPATPDFFVLAQLAMLIACWKTNFFRTFMGDFWERSREREIFRQMRFPNEEAKSHFYTVLRSKSRFFCSLRSVKACLEISAIRNVWAAASRAIVQWKNGACLIEDSDGSIWVSGELAFPPPIWTQGEKLVRMREAANNCCCLLSSLFCCLALSLSVFLASERERWWGQVKKMDLGVANFSLRSCT